MYALQSQSDIGLEFIKFDVPLVSDGKGGGPISLLARSQAVVLLMWTLSEYSLEVVRRIRLDSNVAI